MRGKHVTKPIEKVVEEARELAADGVRELNLVAQDMTYYGVDLYGRPRLAELLRALEEVEGIDWIRVLYNYPNYFTDELYETLSTSRKVLPLPRYAASAHQRPDAQDDEPAAHAGRDRGDHRAAALEHSRTWCCGRRSSPGFRARPRPSSRRCSRFVEETRFERLGVFPYSFEPDTPAAKLPGHLAAEVKTERCDRIMAAQQEIAFAFNQSLVGRTLDVLIDAPAAEAKNLWVGRSYADAPDVDGVTYVRGSGLEPGDLVACVDRWDRGLRHGRPRRVGPAEAAPGPAEAAKEAVVAARDPELIPESGARWPRAYHRGSGTSRTR